MHAARFKGSSASSYGATGSFHTAAESWQPSHCDSPSDIATLMQGGQGSGLSVRAEGRVVGAGGGNATRAAAEYEGTPEWDSR